MKRTNLVLDAVLLDEAQRLSGERTYSRTVEPALDELVRRARRARFSTCGFRGVAGRPGGVRRIDASTGEGAVVLVDTSAWIEVFRMAELRLEDDVDFDDVVTCLPVIQEVLQGFDQEGHFAARARRVVGVSHG